MSDVMRSIKLKDPQMPVDGQVSSQLGLDPCDICAAVFAVRPVVRADASGQLAFADVLAMVRHIS